MQRAAASESDPVTFHAAASWCAPAVIGGGATAARTAADDRSLVRELQRGGDEDLFATLVERHKQRVLIIAAAVLGPGHEAEAEDIAQDAFLTAFRTLANFRGECSFGTWIIRVARNLAIDRSRRADHRRPHLCDDVLEGHSSPATGDDPETGAFADQRRRVVLDALDNLNHTQRMVVYLHYWVGCPVAEIANLLELNRETVKSHLHRSRQRLATVLEEHRIRG
jgi:RNA polymerase sigma-70 factor (ECF subfamily)